MNFNQLGQLKNLLEINPNTASLNNENKIKLIRLNKLIKKEIELYSEAQEGVLAKYGLTKDGEGSYEPSAEKLKAESHEKWVALDDELKGLGESEASDSIAPLKCLNVEEFSAYTKDKVIKHPSQNRKDFDFFYTLPELEILSDFLLID